jgi:hypothetical protein
MINLAGLRYRNIFSESEGPIVRIETSDLFLEGRRLFQANAYLRPDLLGGRRTCSVYSNAAGTGTHESPMVARFIAISESLERWAYRATVHAENRADFGFDADPMSNGMAAFPGLVARQARRKAYLEAIERFSVIAWWEGRLAAVECPTEYAGVEAVVIGTGSGEIVVILHKRTPDGLYAYGHAAGDDFADACRRALIELGRHQEVIKYYWLARRCGCVAVDAPTDLLERRSVYFASAEGHEAFLRRVRSRPSSAPVRRLIFDGRIPGPWERYAHVWRVVFQPVSELYLQEADDYFLW